MTRLHIIAYDVSTPATQRRLHRLLKARGAWHQLSVFILRLDDAARQRLAREIAALVDTRHDRVLIAPLRSLDGGDIMFIGPSEELPGAKVVIL